MSRKIACITVDMEADFLDPSGRIRLFEDEGLLERFTSIIQEGGVKATAFLVTSLIPKHEAAYRRLAEKIPLEFAIHSHAHDMRNPCTPEDIRLAARAFEDFTGQRPLGYRAPVGKITREGLETLMELGFQYDSSVYPSRRPGRWGYNNLHLPVTPFIITAGDRSIIEVPFGGLTGIRLNFSLSYVKLLGWQVYALLLRLFPLPDQVAVLTHPHDYYFHLVRDHVTTPERFLLMRNARAAFSLLEKMIQHLRAAGYDFEFMSGLCREVQTHSLTRIALEDVSPRGRARAEVRGS